MNVLTQSHSLTRRLAAAGLALALALTLAAGTAHAAADAPVDINKASVEQLTELPGVGTTLAARIVEYREQQGPFSSAEELMNVKGIGEKSFEKLRPQVTVGTAKKAADSR